MTSVGSKCCFTIEVRFESVFSNCKLIARCFCWCERSFDRHKLNVPSNTARMLHQHYLNVINAITLILDTYLNLLCVWKYVDITLRSTAVVWRLHAILTTQCYLKLMKVTVHKSGPPLQIALTSVSWIVLQCHCVETVKVRCLTVSGDGYPLRWCCHLHHLQMQ